MPWSNALIDANFSLNIAVHFFTEEELMFNVYLSIPLFAINFLAHSQNAPTGCNITVNKLQTLM